MEYPINARMAEIVETINNNVVTIVSAETGAGKSTQVPQALWAEGYEVIVTEPRRLAARSLAYRVAEEMGTELGELVGYQTGFEANRSMQTEVLFVTDGLQLVREITSQPKQTKRVLIIDELHERNINQSTLVAWCKKQIIDGWDIKVVLMSATLDKEALSQYFNNAPIIDVQGRMYDVEAHQLNEHQMVEAIVKQVEQKRDVLVFLSGKREIYDMADRLVEAFADTKCTAVILPLHGELEVEEQNRCFENYEIPKVVLSTNVAQTSVTVPGITAVIDSGLEKRIELIDGVESLREGDISQSDCLQCKGRAGREAPGIYYLCSSVDLENREAFAIPEIQRKSLDQVVLRLASIGMDMEDLDFFHSVKKENIQQAKRLLTKLGALANGKITPMGVKMSKMPIATRYARMLIEAEERGVLDDVCTIVAIMEIGSIKDNRQYSLSLYSAEHDSDFLVQLDYYKTVCSRFRENSQNIWEGVNKKFFYRAKELKNKLFKVFAGMGKLVTSTGNREQIKLACLSGMTDSIYHVTSDWRRVYCQNSDLDRRFLDRNSNISCRDGFVVGFPKSFETKDHHVINILTMCTKVSVDYVKTHDSNWKNMAAYDSDWAFMLEE